MEPHSFIITFPDWVYVVFSTGVLSFIVFAIYNYIRIREVCKEFPGMRRALNIISYILFKAGLSNTELYVSSSSPCKITPEGEQVLEDSHFEEFFKANKENFFAQISLRGPKTEARVEAAARELMLYLDIEKTPKAELVENFAYNIGTPLPVILFVYAIEIRNRYLAEHPIIH